MTIEYLIPILQALHSGELVWARTNDPSAIKQGGWEPIDGVELTVGDGFVLLNVEVGSDTYEIAEAKDIVIGESAMLLAQAESLQEIAHTLCVLAEVVDRKNSENE